MVGKTCRQFSFFILYLYGQWSFSAIFFGCPGSSMCYFQPQQHLVDTAIGMNLSHFHGGDSRTVPQTTSLSPAAPAPQQQQKRGGGRKGGRRRGEGEVFFFDVCSACWLPHCSSRTLMVCHSGLSALFKRQRHQSRKKILFNLSREKKRKALSPPSLEGLSVREVQKWQPFSPAATSSEKDPGSGSKRERFM